jgi:hypothetical protein
MSSQTGKKKSLVLNAFVEMCAFNNTYSTPCWYCRALTAAIGGLQAVVINLPGSGAILTTSLHALIR